MPDSENEETCNRILLVSVVALCGLALVLNLADSYGQPERYVRRLTRGMSYEQVTASVPRRFIVADLHEITTSKYDFGRERKERMGINASQMVVLRERLWPLTTATVSVLYFDEQNRLVDSFISGS